MPTTMTGETHRCVNLTGVDIPAGSLIALTGWSTIHRTPTVSLAQANGANRKADYIASVALTNNRVGYARRDHDLENQNTVGRTVEDPVYLSPTVAGGYTFTRPTGASQDIQPVGSVLSVSATVGIIRFNLQAGGEGGWSADGIPDIVLASKMYRDIGQAGSGWIEVSGAGVANGDNVSIGGRIYEFDTDPLPGSVAAGSVRVGVSAGEGGAAAPNAIAQLVVAINGDASRVVNAADIGGNVAALVALVTGTAGNYALLNTVDAGGTIAISGATLLGGLAPATQMRLSRSYAITAADVTTLARTLGTSEIVLGCFPSTTQPVLRGAHAQRPGTGAILSIADGLLTLRQVNAAFWALCYAEPAGGALLQAADVVSYDLSVAG